MLGRSYSWLDQRSRAGQFILPDGNTAEPLRDAGRLSRFTLQMLRDIILASAARAGSHGGHPICPSRGDDRQPTREHWRQGRDPSMYRPRCL